MARTLFFHNWVLLYGPWAVSCPLFKTQSSLAQHQNSPVYPLPHHYWCSDHPPFNNNFNIWVSIYPRTPLENQVSCYWAVGGDLVLCAGTVHFSRLYLGDNQAAPSRPREIQSSKPCYIRAFGAEPHCHSDGYSTSGYWIPKPYFWPGRP